MFMVRRFAADSASQSGVGERLPRNSFIPQPSLFQPSDRGTPSAKDGLKERVVYNTQNNPQIPPLFCRTLSSNTLYLFEIIWRALRDSNPHVTAVKERYAKYTPSAIRKRYEKAEREQSKR
jgi:hypothetical protein